MVIDVNLDIRKNPLNIKRLQLRWGNLLSTKRWCGISLLVLGSVNIESEIFMDYLEFF